MAICWYLGCRYTWHFSLFSDARRAACQSLPLEEQSLPLQERHFYSLHSLSPCSVFLEMISHGYLQSALIHPHRQPHDLSTIDVPVSAMITKITVSSNAHFPAFSLSHQKAVRELYKSMAAIKWQCRRDKYIKRFRELTQVVCSSSHWVVYLTGKDLTVWPAVNECLSHSCHLKPILRIFLLFRKIVIPWLLGK